MPPCNANAAVLDALPPSGENLPSKLTKRTSESSLCSSSDSGSDNTSNDAAAPVGFSIRPYPWCLVSDRTWSATGTVLLLTMFFPGISLIVLSTASGEFLQYALYKKNPVGRFVLDRVRAVQRFIFYQIGRRILMDTRDSSYLPWMAHGLFILPVVFFWARARYMEHGFEFTTFLIYHLCRLGPRYRFFAHHECLTHIEGHASKKGLYCNPWTLLTTGKRVPLTRRNRRLFFDHINGALIGPFYGSLPNSYGAAHNKIHHRWHNDTGDVHTNMDVDRTAGISSFVLWFPRFLLYWVGLSPCFLFWKRRERGLLKMMLGGMAYYYGLSALVCYTSGFFFYWTFWLYPQLEATAFLGGIGYMWHAFSEESDPSNQYVNSMTILRGHDNIWNEDYHVVHHHDTYVHWSEMPQSFERHKAEYVKCRATVFADCEQGLFFAWMFGRKWDEMTDFFVDLQYVFSNGDKNSDRLRNVREVAAEERKLRVAKGDDPIQVEAELKAYHAEMKAMLLKRLSYHYLETFIDDGTGNEWEQFDAKLKAGLREYSNAKNE